MTHVNLMRVKTLPEDMAVRVVVDIPFVWII